MKPRWLIENFTGDNGYEGLIKEIRKQGMECTVLDITNHFELKPDIFKPNDCIIFQGSIQLFDKLKKELGDIGCYPIGWCTDENYLCSNYYPKLNPVLFNDKYIITTVKNLKEYKWKYYAQYGKEALIFVRPDDGKKSFVGQLLDLQDFDKFWDNDVACASKEEDLVIITTPKNIIGEWRFVVNNKKEIIGYSCYKYQDQRTYIPSAPRGAVDKCKEVLDIGYYPDVIFTVDICQDKDEDFHLLELNSFTCAGTYEINKEILVKRVSEIAEEEYGNRNK